jgi:hypothetical protein
LARFGWLALGAVALAALCGTLTSASGNAARRGRHRASQQVTLSVYFLGFGTGRITSSPQGIDCDKPCSASFPSGTTVTLTATPALGSSILRWPPRVCREQGNGTLPPNGPTCTFTLSDAISVYVYFEPAPTLNVYFLGTGSGRITSSPAGIDCDQPCKASFPHGTKVTLTAVPKAGASILRWSPGACQEQGNKLTPYARSTCTFVLDDNQSIYVYFSPAPTLFLYITGRGQVRSSPAGIACSESCKASFPSRAKVVLTATPAAGWRIDSWSDGCREQGKKLNSYHGKACTLVMDAEKTANISFVKPPRLDPGEKPVPPQPPPPSSMRPNIGVVVSVSGNGRVVSSTTGTQQIDCGSGTFRCSSELSAGTRLSLRAIPSPGFVFTRWDDACSGQPKTCVTRAASTKRVTARFATKSAGTSVDVSLQQPEFRVRWVNSAASGIVLLRGFAANSANIRIEIRSVSGPPVLTTRLRVAGSFRLTEKLTPGRLLPGGFVAVLTGASGGRTLPQQLAAVVLPSPPEGLVARAFLSRTRGGPPISNVPAKAHEVWAVFVFGSLPKPAQAVAVRWYWPNGKLLGEIKKPSQVKISSFIRANPVLPSGAWRGELRVGQSLVKALRVPIGCTKC